MIFATFGTAAPFPRFLNRLDELAKETGLEIVAQTGTTPQTAKYCKTFDYAPSLDEYYSAAFLVISHAGLGIPMELLKMGKPFVVCPRLACYGEHNNDHQLEICEMLHKKYGVLYYPDFSELTASLLYNPPAPYHYSDEPLQRFRNGVARILLK